MKDVFSTDTMVWAAGFKPSGNATAQSSLTMVLPFIASQDELCPANVNAIYRKARFGRVSGIPSGATDSAYAKHGKRFLDLALILLALPVVVMVTLVCAAVLWLESGLPFYWQKRLGRNGRTFHILKLRTMVRNADAQLAQCLARDPALREEWETTQKLKNDPRVTRVGAFLRRTSLDELPQLWNVVKGDMSLVGPRPMMPEQLPLYGESQYYFAVRPGITGIWQVSARNESSFAFRYETDAEYHRTMSFRTDLKLLFRTIGVVLRGTGY